MVSLERSTPRRRRTTVSRRRDATCSRVLARSASSSANPRVASISSLRRSVREPEAFEPSAEPRFVRRARSSSSRKRSSSADVLALRSHAALRAAAKKRTLAAAARLSCFARARAVAATSSTAAATCAGASATSARRDAETRASRGDIRHPRGAPGSPLATIACRDRSEFAPRPIPLPAAAASAAAEPAARAREGASLASLASLAGLAGLAGAFAGAFATPGSDPPTHGDAPFGSGRAPRPSASIRRSSSTPRRARLARVARGTIFVPDRSEAASTASTSGAALGSTSARRTLRSKRSFRTSCRTRRKCVAPTPRVKSPPPPPPTPPRDFGRSVSSSTSSRNRFSSPCFFLGTPAPRGRSRASSVASSVATDDASGARRFGVFGVSAREQERARSRSPADGSPYGGGGGERPRGDGFAVVAGPARVSFPSPNLGPRASACLDGDGTRSGSKPLALRTALCTISLLSRMRSRGSAGHRVL